MKTNSFSFKLPEELIAQNPSENRGESRLMLLRRSRADREANAEQREKRISHHGIDELPELLPNDSVLVVNDSKVRKARIYGSTLHGGRVEFLLLEEAATGLWKAVVSKAKRQKPGKEYLFPDDADGRTVRGRITGVKGEHRYILFDPPIDDAYLENVGHMPLPPYIRREDTPEDSLRYQTVYAEKTGSIAAPTAGLHLTDEILERISACGIRIVRVTLHVGLGTFQPVRSDDIEDHQMHEERYGIPEETAALVTEAKRAGKPVFAVGTTSVRSLESAWKEKETRLLPGESKTRLYISPGYRFKVVDGLLTNFHTPMSSLLVLVSAFAGKNDIDTAYSIAVRERYRFFSYGDAMLIL
jgi:S-adenosylmethionine:tRNA ribosyltransferase-isomerase